MSRQLPLTIGLLGGPGVGKTTLAHDLTTGTYLRQPAPTYTQRTTSKNVQLSSGTIIVLKVVDTPGWGGQHNDKSIYKSILNQCDGLIVVYAINDKSSFLLISEIMNEVRSIKPLPTTIVATKTDLEHQRTVSKQEANNLATKLGVLHSECNCTRPDTAVGVFYSVIQAIITKRGIPSTQSSTVTPAHMSLSLKPPPPSSNNVQRIQRTNSVSSYRTPKAPGAAPGAAPNNRPPDGNDARNQLRMSTPNPIAPLKSETPPQTRTAKPIQQEHRVDPRKNISPLPIQTQQDSKDKSNNRKSSGALLTRSTSLLGRTNSLKSVKSFFRSKPDSSPTTNQSEATPTIGASTIGESMVIDAEQREAAKQMLRNSRASGNGAFAAMRSASAAGSSPKYGTVRLSSKNKDWDEIENMLKDGGDLSPKGKWQTVTSPRPQVRGRLSVLGDSGSPRSK